MPVDSGLKRYGGDLLSVYYLLKPKPKATARSLAQTHTQSKKRILAIDFGWSGDGGAAAK